MTGHDYSESLQDSISGGMEGMGEFLSDNMMYIGAAVIVIIIIIIIWWWSGQKEGVTAGGCQESTNPLVAHSICGGAEGFGARKELMNGGPMYTQQWSQILGQQDCQAVNASRAQLLKSIGCADVGAPLDCTPGGPYVDAAGNFVYKPESQQSAEAWGWMRGQETAAEQAAAASMAASQGPEGFSRRREGLSDADLTKNLAGVV